MNILITGGNGQLGRSIQRTAENSIHNFIFTDIDTLDITDEAQVHRVLREEKIDIVVNCAAYTNVDNAEDNPGIATRLNVEAPAILASEIERTGGFMIHISTDYVFSGTGNVPILESDEISPLGVYGKTKALGEQRIADCTNRYIIIRTAWLYSEYGHNFVKTMIRLTSGRPEIMVVADQIGTPTYAGDLAETILKIIDAGNLEEKAGIYHYTDYGVCSWFDLAHEVNALCGNDCMVLPCLTSEYPSKARRPAYSVLSKRKIKNEFHLRIPYWRDSLVKCITNIRLSDNV